MSEVPGTQVDEDGFRPRGIEPLRIDAFSDVVFGFAVGIVVVSLDMPKTYIQIHLMLKGLFPSPCASEYSS